MGFGDVAGTTNKKPVSGFGSISGGQTITGSFGFGKVDTGTVKGLQVIAQKSGLEKKATKTLETKGEDPQKIFSGGFISDIFDGLNALQYGVTGLLKGKGFMEGVKTRQSFSDKDALGNYGIPGTIGGIALDIAVDPLTYIPPLAIAKKIPGLVKGVKAIGEVAEALKIGQWFGRKFIYRFGQDPIYKEIAERSIKNIAVGQKNLLDIARPLTKLDPVIQKTVADFRKAGKLAELPEEVLTKVKPIFDELDNLGKQAVDVGLLSKETWEKNLGKYLPRLYTSKEAPEGVVSKLKGIFPSKPNRIELSRFMKRKDIPEEIREVMGEIMEAGYPTAKGLVQMKSAVEHAKLFAETASKWGSDVLKEGFEKLPDTKRLGQLTSKFVPKAIYDDIQEITRIKTPLEKGLGKIVGGFKFGKVILNPATHARNIMSNSILNSWEGLNPYRIDIYGEAAKELITKGKWYQEATEQGLGLNTYAAKEIKDLLLGPEGQTALGKFKGSIKGIAEKISDLYQKEEEFAKMAQFIFQRKGGKTAEEAMKVAERATFNYAQVTPFIRRLRESIFGFPFITFTYKATPQTIKTLATKPAKISVIGKMKNAIENMADAKELQRERASEPSYIRDGFYIKLPIKDQYGRSSYFDLTYILPFGDLVAGNYFTRQIKRETGLRESVPEAMAEKSPFFNTVKELVRNQDFYGDKIWNESDGTDKQLGDLMRHLTKTYLPPLIADQIPGGYTSEGKRRLKGIAGIIQPKEDIGQQRNLMQEMLRNVGLKIQPIDVDLQESYMNWEKEKALQTILKEENIIKEFKKSYIPKK